MIFDFCKLPAIVFKVEPLESASTHLRLQSDGICCNANALETQVVTFRIMDVAVQFCFASTFQPRLSDQFSFWPGKPFTANKAPAHPSMTNKPECGPALDREEATNVAFLKGFCYQKYSEDWNPIGSTAWK